MKNKTKTKPKDKFSFIQLSRAWYGPANLQMDSGITDEIVITMNRDSDGDSGEILIRWKVLNRETRQSAPQISAFDDAWKALARCKGLLQELAKLDSTNPAVQDVVKVLKRLGMKDVTPTKNPDSVVIRMEKNRVSIESRKTAASN